MNIVMGWYICDFLSEELSPDVLLPPFKRRLAEISRGSLLWNDRQ